MLSKICLFALIALAASQRVLRSRGPFGPLDDRDESSCKQAGWKIADKMNMCWYHACVPTSEATYKLMPMECPLGTRVRYTYVEGEETPCKHLYPYEWDYECSREADTRPQEEPFCSLVTECKNGGTVMHEDAICWCKCPPEWSGDSDCSKPVNQDLIDNPSQGGGCVDGSDGIDHCAINGGCLNGGTCHNQCGGFWCDCVSPYRLGKRCEKFSCERDFECFNNGTCLRGLNSNAPNEARRCRCLPGTMGYRCEIDLRDDIEREAQRAAADAAGK